jgi:hypothetical protein
MALMNMKTYSIIYLILFKVSSKEVGFIQVFAILWSSSYTDSSYLHFAAIWLTDYIRRHQLVKYIPAYRRHVYRSEFILSDICATLTALMKKVAEVSPCTNFVHKSAIDVAPSCPRRLLICSCASVFVKHCSQVVA